MDRILTKLMPLTFAMVVLASAGAHAQLGTNSLNPGMPGALPPAASGGFSPGITAPGSFGGVPTQSHGISNPRISNYGAAGEAREPGSLPRFH